MSITLDVQHHSLLLKKTEARTIRARLSIEAPRRLPSDSRWSFDLMRKRTSASSLEQRFPSISFQVWQSSTLLSQACWPYSAHPSPKIDAEKKMPVSSLWILSQSIEKARLNSERRWINESSDWAWWVSTDAISVLWLPGCNSFCLNRHVASYFSAEKQPKL